MTAKMTLKALASAATLALSAGVAQASHEGNTPSPGYLIDSSGHYVRNSYGECWRTGYWTPEMAVAECDPDLVAQAEPAAPPPPPPAPEPEAGPPAPAFEAIEIQAETLFDFDKATLRSSGRQTLDTEVVSKLQDNPEVEVVLVSGHADRIGSESYNTRLSQRRAEAVKTYLVSKGIAENRIETEAKGESEPVVACDDVKGRESGRNRALVECLQPNRRVVVEVKIQAPASDPAAAGDAGTAPAPASGDAGTAPAGSESAEPATEPMTTEPASGSTTTVQ